MSQFPLQLENFFQWDTILAVKRALAFLTDLRHKIKNEATQVLSSLSPKLVISRQYAWK